MKLPDCSVRVCTGMGVQVIRLCCLRVRCRAPPRRARSRTQGPDNPTVVLLYIISCLYMEMSIQNNPIQGRIGGGRMPARGSPGEKQSRSHQTGVDEFILIHAGINNHIRPALSRKSVHKTIAECTYNIRTNKKI